ncbi:MAG: alpha-hydroxy-acid oxidizing protein [Actinomycetota bacterium]|nr:alpha-hydroxy-acid oxidizing protein [Actinomycetota bacterium]
MPEEPFASYQYEIYLSGTRGIVPEYPVSVAELEKRAEEVMSTEARGYVSGAAGSESTMRANLEAFARSRLVPRMLRDVNSRRLSTRILETEMPAPLLLAPIGVQGIVHKEAELAPARAAASLGIPVVLSTAASRTMEEVAEACGSAPRWFQLYWPNDPELTESLLRRAQNAGYEAVVVTLDTPLLAWRPRDLQAGFLPFLKGEGLANYFSDPVFRNGLDKSPEEDLGAAVLRWVSVFSNPGATWGDLEFLRQKTRLPIVLKGILHEDDAKRAADVGVDGVVVSNHGGRQVDGAIATLEALPNISAAVGDRLTVLLDGGIRTGADIVKALALGASAVLLGRPYIWGLAVGGEDGVRQVLRGLLAELDLSVALCGYSSIHDLGPEVVRGMETTAPRP